MTGHKVTNDWDLIQQLKAWHNVTLIKREQLSFDESFLKSVSVLILDCNNTHDLELEIFPYLRKWKKDFPGLCVVLVNGGLTQEEIALAFKVGVRDYFPEPYDVNLLIERIQYLGYL
jgi:DNA-binding response OmpR family regulator